MSQYTPEAFVAELRTVLENVQTELSATGRHSARIQWCIEAMPWLDATLRQQDARVDDWMVRAAAFIQKKADDYAAENCSEEYDTGALVYRYGQAGEDYHHTLVELAEEVAALSAQPAPEHTAAPVGVPEDNSASVAAIQFALSGEDGLAFLRCWNEGNFDACRKEWPEAPAECYIGADPLAPSAPQGTQQGEG